MIAMTWWNRENLNDHDAIVCDGAIRSGKTVAMTVGFFLWSMACHDNKVFALCGKTIGALRRNVIIHLTDWLGGVLQITEHRGDNRITVRAWGKQNTYYLFGGQDEQSYSLIQGITLAGVLLDEAALMPRSFVEQALARCSEQGSKMWLNCNPQGQEHWLYKEWILKAGKKNALHLHFTMDDNPALEPAVRARYETLYDGAFYRRYILGLWCSAEGRIYNLEQRHICQRLPKEGQYYISVDYGTQNPFSAGLWCVTGDTAVRIREFYYCGREAGRMRTDEEYHQDLKALAGGLPIRQVIIDPSAASMIALLRRKGVFRVRKARNQVLEGIQLVARLLQEGRLLIGKDCHHAIREFSQYVWQEGQDAPKKEHDHAMDEIRYFAMTVLRRKTHPPLEEGRRI